MAKPFKKALTISTCLLVAVALTIGAVAWFSGYMKIGTVGFDTSSNANLPKLDMWMYYSENDGATPATEGWVKQDVVNDPSGRNEYLIIPGVGEETETVNETTVVIDGENESHTENVLGEDGNPVYKTYYSYQIPQLHFGKVDNLVTLKPDNKVMLRFFFDASMLNNAEGKLHDITFSLAYNTAGYNYDENAVSVLDSVHLLKEVDRGAEEINLKVPVNQDKIDAAIAFNEGKDEADQIPVPEEIYVLECLENRPAAMQFLQIRYAVGSKTDIYEPIGEGFGRTVTVKNDDNTETTKTEMLTLSAPLPINCGFGGKNTNCAGCNANKCGKITLSDEDLEAILGEANKDDNTYDIGEGFYVYIELAPLLDAFGMQENILDYFVPAYMLFDVKLDVEIG